MLYKACLERLVSRSLEDPLLKPNPSYLILNIINEGGRGLCD